MDVIRLMKLFLMCWTLMGIMKGTAQIPAYLPSDGLVAWWPFSGNANDGSGNNNHAANVTASLTSDRFGNPASAYLFSGSFIAVPMTPALHTLPERTFSCWYKSTGAQNGGFIYATSNYFGSYFNGGISVSNGDLLNFYYCNGTYSNTASGIDGGENQVWHHLVFVTNSFNGATEIFVDGELAYSGTGVLCDPPTSWSNEDMRFGTGPSGQNFNGGIDDIAIWNRALTLEEIQQLYISCALNILEQPQNLVANIGATATLVAQAEPVNANYQWQTNVGNGWVDLSNAGQYSGTNEEELIISNLSVLNDNQYFRCVITFGGCGLITDEVYIHICSIQISEQPSDQQVSEGNNATFPVIASGEGLLYQWQTNAGLGWQNLSEIGQYSGTSGSTLTVSNVTAANDNQLFRCRITAPGCTQITDEVSIQVESNSVFEWNKWGISLLPNPTTDTFYLQTESFIPRMDFWVFDTTGRTVFRGSLSGDRQMVDISSFQPGTYFIRVGSDVLRLVKV